MDLRAEHGIIEGLKLGGRERQKAEQDLYKTYFYLIDHGAKKHNLLREDAASAYSDAVITAIMHVINGKFEGRSQFKSYLYQIFSNKCVDLLRKETTNKRKAEHAVALDSLVFELPDKSRNVIQQIIARDQWQQLMQGIATLGGKCKELLLFFEDGYSDKEITEMTDYNSPEVVKTSRLRCLDKLRKLMHVKER